MSADEVHRRLKRAGWLISDIAGARGWVVNGTNGEYVVHVAAATRREAWHRAAEQAAAFGMLAPDIVHYPERGSL